MLECQWKLKLLVAMQIIFAIGKFVVQVPSPGGTACMFRNDGC